MAMNVRCMAMVFCDVSDEFTAPIFYPEDGGN
jgi:hypothetical protein